MKNFVVLDFDNTVVDGNTDTVVRNMEADNREYQRDKTNTSFGWSDKMSNVLSRLAEKGVAREHIEKSVTSIPFVEGFVDFIRFVAKAENADDSHSNTVKLFIVSHSNTNFIDLLLNKVGLKTLFPKILTYPSEWQSQGHLKVFRYHEPLPRKCWLCPIDFCKGYVLEEEILHDDNVVLNNKNSRIFYIGDGTSDFCAALNLRESDYIMYRRGYQLESLINAHHCGQLQEEDRKLKASAVPWSNGHDLTAVFNSIIT